MDRANAEAVFEPAARQALKSFPLGTVDLEFVHISENVTFRVTEKDGSATYVLRLHRPGYHSIEALKSERVWTRALAAAGVAVPELVLTSNGEDYVQVVIEALNESRWAGLARWIDGELLGGIIEAEPVHQINARHFSKLGAMLACAHDQASDWARPAGFIRHCLDADGLMGAQPFWGPFWDYERLSAAERCLLLDTRETIRAALLRYGKSPRTFSMIHADLHPGNVIVDGGHLAMIDFDDAAFGWHQFDIAVALVLYQDQPHFDLFRDACIEGYRTARSISDADLELLPMFQLARSMVQLGWYHERPEIKLPPRLEGLKDHVCEVAASFEPPC